MTFLPRELWQDVGQDSSLTDFWMYLNRRREWPCGPSPAPRHTTPSRPWSPSPPSGPGMLTLYIAESHSISGRTDRCPLSPSWPVEALLFLINYFWKMFALWPLPSTPFPMLVASLFISVTISWRDIVPRIEMTKLFLLLSFALRGLHSFITLFKYVHDVGDLNWWQMFGHQRRVTNE